MSKLSSKTFAGSAANPNESYGMLLRVAELTMANYTPTTTEDAETMLTNLLESCQVLGVPVEFQEELLGKIIDKAAETGNSALYDVALDKSHALTKSYEGPSPISADNGGREPVFH